MGITVLMYESQRENTFPCGCYSIFGFLDQKHVVLVTLGCRMPDNQEHSSRSSSHQVHVLHSRIACSCQGFLGKEGSQSCTVLKMTKASDVQLLGKMSSKFLKDFINNITIYYNYIYYIVLYQ